MIKKLLISCFSMLTFLTVQAQDSLQVKPQVSAPYKLAIGARFAAGAATGGDLSVSAKYFIGKESALEVQSSVNPESHFFLASLSYIWQPKLATSDRFRPYAGLGVGVLRSRNYYYDGSSMNEFIKVNPVGVATFGIEYTFKNAPIALSLDYRSTFLRYDNSNRPTYFSLNQSSNLALGVKYTFR